MTNESEKVRTTPRTVEALQDWYAARGLPPYEVTRFFIGQDCREARAFGIYRDALSGDFIVYKNKDSGERAVRYQGPDEAYAVSVLLEKLKAEILQQKECNTPRSFTEKKSAHRGRSGCLLAVMISMAAVVVGIVAAFLADAPTDGYYRYEDAIYYHDAHSEPEGYTDWFLYDSASGQWHQVAEAALPENLKKNKQAQAFFLSGSVPPEEAADHPITSSEAWLEVTRSDTLRQGYYRQGDQTWYHLEEDYLRGWYIYQDASWRSCSYDSLPRQLRHDLLAEEWYYDPDWSDGLPFSDFTDTDYYADYVEQHGTEDSDADYDWDDGYTWDSNYTDWSSDW